MTTARIVTDSDRDIWIEYLAKQSTDTHAFCWEWRAILSEVFGHQACYLIAEDGSRVHGIAPLYLFQSFLFGKALVSVPYLNAGGLLYDSAPARTALLTAASELYAKENCGYLELRHRDAEKLEGCIERSHKVAMVLSLRPDPQEVFQKFPAKLRSQIRRPEKSGLTARVLSGSEATTADVNAFYRVFSQNMRDLGTPVYPQNLFAKTLSSFGERARLILVYHETTPVAGAITITVGQTTEIPWASALREFSQHSPNMLLYWETIRAACLAGSQAFDFGRSTKDSGPYRFKLQWGAVEKPLHWYYLASSKKLPDVNPQSGRFHLATSLWRKLPLPVANFVGPMITKALP